MCISVSVPFCQPLKPVPWQVCEINGTATSIPTGQGRTWYSGSLENGQEFLQEIREGTLGFLCLSAWFLFFLISEDREETGKCVLI